MPINSLPVSSINTARKERKRLKEIASMDEGSGADEVNETLEIPVSWQGKRRLQASWRMKLHSGEQVSLLSDLAGKNQKSWVIYIIIGSNYNKHQEYDNLSIKKLLESFNVYVLSVDLMRPPPLAENIPEGLILDQLHYCMRMGKLSTRDRFMLTTRLQEGIRSANIMTVDKLFVCNSVAVGYNYNAINMLFNAASAMFQPKQAEKFDYVTPTYTGPGGSFLKRPNVPNYAAKLVKDFIQDDHFSSCANLDNSYSESTISNGIFNKNNPTDLASFFPDGKYYRRSEQLPPSLQKVVTDIFSKYSDDDSSQLKKFLKKSILGIPDIIFISDINLVLNDKFKLELTQHEIKNDAFDFAHDEYIRKLRKGL